MLGGLEQKAMDALWSTNEPLKPADVQAKIEGEYAYTTIMTTLKRLHDKKIVKRKLVGNVYFYLPTQDKVTFASACLDDLFNRLFESYGKSPVTDSYRRVLAKSKPVV
jgi:predicted transcriptional regulator